MVDFFEQGLAQQAAKPVRSTALVRLLAASAIKWCNSLQLDPYQAVLCLQGAEREVRERLETR